MPIMPAQEQELIRECQAGRVDAFGGLYDAYIEKIYRYLFYRLRDQSQAEDLTSIVFIKALEKINTFNPQKGNFSAWIYRVARNTLFDHLRGTPPTRSLTDAEEIPAAHSIEKEADFNYQKELILKELDQLSETERDIIHLRVWDELPYKEIAAIVGKTEANCQMIFSRTVHKLQRVLGPGAFIVLLFSKY